MPKNFQYVCDKCGKTEFPKIHDTPENRRKWGDLYFCSKCFASLAKPIARAIDDA